MTNRPSSVGPRLTPLTTSPPAHFGLAGRTSVRGTRLVLAHGQQSYLTHTKILGSVSSKFFGRSHLLRLWQGLCHPPSPRICLVFREAAQRRQEGLGNSLGLSAPSVTPGHMAWHRPWGEGAVTARPWGWGGQGSTSCLVLCLHPAPTRPHCSPRTGGQPDSLHVACGGYSWPPGSLRSQDKRPSL